MIEMKANPVTEHFTALGRRGGLAVRNQKQAGHATAAKLFRRLAVQCRQNGDQAEAEALTRRAEEQERLAASPVTVSKAK